MSLTEALVQDETGAIKVVWFNRPYLTKVLKKGDIVFLSGKIAIRGNSLYLSNPAYEKLSSSCRANSEATKKSLYFVLFAPRVSSKGPFQEQRPSL